MCVLCDSKCENGYWEWVWNWDWECQSPAQQSPHVHVAFLCKAFNAHFRQFLGTSFILFCLNSFFFFCFGGVFDFFENYVEIVCRCIAAAAAAVFDFDFVMVCLISLMPKVFQQLELRGFFSRIRIHT